LDYRKCNLKTCNKPPINQPKSIRSKSIYKGVSWDSHHKKWRVAITVNKKMVSIGRFLSEHDAALAYNKAAIKHFGEFAKLNEIRV
jgi:hypothetical protein